MTFTGGNKAIRDHLDNGKELLLFEKVRRDGSVRFMGHFSCIGYEHQKAPDTDGNIRQAIVFQLLPLSDFLDGHQEGENQNPSSFRELRDKAYQGGGEAQAVSLHESKQQAFKRSSFVRAYALERASGICEHCDQPAPFKTSSGKPFLEVHHITRLSDGGPDRPDKVAAICPNCHRAAHYSEMKRAINFALLERIRGTEPKLSEQYG